MKASTINRLSTTQKEMLDTVEQKRRDAVRVQQKKEWKKAYNKAYNARRKAEAMEKKTKRGNFYSTATIKVERNVPIPTGKSWNAHKYPFASMKVGDSFKVLRKGNSNGALYSAAKLAKIKVTVRQLNTRMIRVWRIK